MQLERLQSADTYAVARVLEKMYTVGSQLLRVHYYEAKIRVSQVQIRNINTPNVTNTIRRPCSRIQMSGLTNWIQWLNQVTERRQHIQQFKNSYKNMAKWKIGQEMPMRRGDVTEKPNITSR